MRYVMLLLLPGPGPIWGSEWVGVLPAFVTVDDVCHWPYSVGVVALACFWGLTWGWWCLLCGVAHLVRALAWGETCSGRRLFSAIDALVAQFPVVAQ